MVRRLLECLTVSDVVTDVNQNINEAFIAAEEKAIIDTAPSGGDQWMANPAWKKTAESMLPKNIIHIDTKPSTVLELEWVHGYRGYDCRNNLRYLDESARAFNYHAAALGIAYVKGDEETDKKQIFFGEHGDDIISHAVCYKGKEYSGPTLIATGEIGKKPAIYIYSWSENAQSFSPVTSMRGYHRAGVCQMAFSKDGSSIFTVSVDYSIAVYCTQLTYPGKVGKMICSSQGPKDRIFDCCSLTAAPGDFVSCGEKHISYWASKNSAIVQEQVKLGKFKRDFVMCATAVAGAKQCVAGTSEGNLVYVQSGCLMKDLCIDNLHKKAINSLHSVNDGKIIITGGADGKVCCLRINGLNHADIQIHILKAFNVYASGISEKQIHPIRSVCMSTDCTKLLVGTQASEIVEVTAPHFEPLVSTDVTENQNLIGKIKQKDMKARVSPIDYGFKEELLVVGHYKEELWGLAIRPLSAKDAASGKGHEYCTVGDDGFLRVWDLETKRQKKYLDMGPSARCCDYSPDGQYLAVGFGGSRSSKRNKHNGAVRIYRADTEPLLQVCELKEAKQWISKLKFSPDGSILAVGSRDNSIYAYSVAQQFKRKSKFSKHNAGILDFDFSEDGKYIQSTCSAYELLFSDHSNGAQLTSGATLLAEEKWCSWTCSLGWPVMGIWNGTMDGSDVNCVDRSDDRTLIAVGDDSGKVNVYRYPSTLEDRDGAPHHEYLGHSSHVTMVRWVSDKYLISTGGNDKCVFQWKAMAGDSTTGSSVSRSTGDDNSLTNILELGPSGGDEFTAVKPWLGSIHAPMAWSNPDPAKLPPFFAALGEMSSLHSSLRSNLAGVGEEDTSPEDAARCSTSVIGVVKTAEIYTNHVNAASEVYKSMCSSGVSNGSQPEGDELELEWVHGYRGFDCRNNVFYVNQQKGNSEKNRHIVYHAASLGIMFTIAADGKSKQAYFRGHDDDITAMALLSLEAGQGKTNETNLVATGQQGKGKTFVWEVPSMKTLAILTTGQKTVCQVAFSKAHGGRILVTVGADQSVIVSDWKSQSILGKTKGDAADCYHICTSSSCLSETAFQFLAVGDKFITYWKLNGRNLTSKKVSTAKPSKSKKKEYLNMKFMSSAQIGDQYFIGGEDGNVYQFKPSEEGSHAINSYFPACIESSDPEAKKSKKMNSRNYVFALHAAKISSIGTVLLTGTLRGDVSVFKINESGEEGKQCLGSFNIKNVLSSISAGQIYTLSLDEVVGGVHILVGTRGCDLLEVAIPFIDGGNALNFGLADLVEGIKAHGADNEDRNQWVGALIRGHCNNEVWGLACHPLLPEYITVGDDMSLRCYDITSKKVQFVLPLGAVARACAYNASGSLIAVGFGGRFGRGKEPKGGMVRLYGRTEYPDSGPTEDSLKLLCEVHDAKQWISDIKWSPDGSTLCAAAHDCKIYIYDVVFREVNIGKHQPTVVTASLKLRTTFRKHSSVINHIDISREGRYMQSNCSAYELLFCDLGTGKQVTMSSQLKDVDWDTWSCTLGWPVQGIWQKSMDGSDINATARSHSGHLLATSDDMGQVHLFRYPVIHKDAAYLSYTGHSSHVTNVRWSAADETLISCGGADKCVFQWKHVMNEAAGEATEAHEPHIHILGDNDLNSAEVTDISLLSGPSGGDESGSVKPWLGAVRRPANPPHIDSAKPAVNMTLSWVHGYTAGNRCNTRMCSNLFYASDGEPIYPAASLGVRLDRNATNGCAFKQTYFQGHDDDILCLTMSLDRRFVATGQTPSHASKGMGSICVWSAVDCRLLACMDKCHQRGVYSLAFNRGGTELVSVGQDNKNTHKLWRDLGGNWSRVQCTATATSDQSVLYFSRWLHPENPSGCQIVTGGAKSINFWRLEGATLVKKQGRFGRKYKQAPLLCAANIQAKDEKGGQSGWQTVVGTSKGDFYVFEEREVSNAVQGAHTGAILSLAEGNEKCDFLVSGGADKQVRVWNQALQAISSFDLTNFCIVDASIASLDVRPDVTTEDETCLKILVGSYGGDVFEISSTSQANKKDNQRSLDITSPHLTSLVSSHTTGELWGLSPHPSDPDLYCTVGDDGTFRIWSIKKQRMLAHYDVGHRCRSVAWGPVMPVRSAKEGEAVVLEDIIAIGLDGAEIRKNKNGKKSRRSPKEAFSSKPDGHVHDAVRLLSVSGLTKSAGASSKIIIREIAKGLDDTSCISDIKFSPHEDLTECLRLGVSSHNAKLYVFNLPGSELDLAHIEESWTDCLKAEPASFDKHSSTVTHFDFNIDGTYMQSNCAAGELLFSEIIEKDEKLKIQHITRASNMADFNSIYDPKVTDDGHDDSLTKKWFTQTCHLGWPVQGIWPPGTDTSDINSCDRDFSENFLATGDDFGQVKIFRYPAVEESSKFITLEGHSSHVTNVRWTAGEYLLSTGGNDNCIFVWHAEKQ